MKKTKEYQESSLEAFKREVNKYEVLDEEEQNKLLDEYRKTKNIRILDKLVKHNLRLSIRVARKFTYNRKSMELMDLIQECNISLILAIETYDSSHGTRFSTYAAITMENNIKTAINKKDDIIRKPMYLEVINKKYLKFLDDFSKEKGRYPKEEEVIESLQISKITYDVLKKITNYEIKSLNEIREEDDDKDEFQNFIKMEEKEYERAENTIDDLIIMKAAKNLLTEQEYYVIYFRMISSEELTLEKISQDLEMTRERIRQIEEKSLKKLKNNIREEQKRILETCDIKDLEKENFHPMSLKKKCLLLYFKETLSEEDYYYIYTRNVLNYNLSDYNNDKELAKLIEIYDEMYIGKENSEFIEENYNKYRELYTVYKLFNMSIEPTGDKEKQNNSKGKKSLWKKN